MEDLSGSKARRELTAAREYANLLRQALRLSDEEALQVAYQFGRDMLVAGMSMLEFAVVHRYAMAEIMASRPAADPGHLTSLANRLLVEGLVPFEMVRRALPEAHARLEASEARYRELVENAHDAIFTLDLDGRLTSLNRAGQKLTGYSEPDAVGRLFEDLVAPEHRRLCRALVRPRHAQIPARVTLELLAADGRRVPVEVTTSLLREEGRPRSIQGIARDISDRLLAESALRHLNARLEEKAKQIAHALHDEAGQLLASVYLKVAELERTPSKRARTRFQELRGLLDEVDREIRRLAYELRPAILDDLGLIPALGFLAEGVSKRNHIRVDVIGTTDGRVSNDVETAIYRVVQEALTNAARHGHPTAVRVELSRSPRLLAGRVIDDGAGFEPKAVLGRTSTSLGLIGMRERIAALGGTLAVTSTPGQGTTVQFEVPIEERDAHVSTTRR